MKQLNWFGWVISLCGVWILLFTEVGYGQGHREPLPPGTGGGGAAVEIDVANWTCTQFKHTSRTEEVDCGKFIKTIREGYIIEGNSIDDPIVLLTNIPPMCELTISLESSITAGESIDSKLTLFDHGGQFLKVADDQLGNSEEYPGKRLPVLKYNHINHFGKNNLDPDVCLQIESLAGTMDFDYILKVERKYAKGIFYRGPGGLCPQPMISRISFFMVPGIEPLLSPISLPNAEEELALFGTQLEGDYAINILGQEDHEMMNFLGVDQSGSELYYLMLPGNEGLLQAIVICILNDSNMGAIAPVDTIGLDDEKALKILPPTSLSSTSHGEGEPAAFCIDKGFAGMADGPPSPPDPQFDLLRDAKYRGIEHFSVLGYYHRACSGKYKVSVSGYINIDGVVVFRESMVSPVDFLIGGNLDSAWLSNRMMAGCDFQTTGTEEVAARKLGGMQNGGTTSDPIKYFEVDFVQGELYLILAVAGVFVDQFSATATCKLKVSPIVPCVPTTGGSRIAAFFPGISPRAAFSNDWVLSSGVSFTATGLEVESPQSGILGLYSYDDFQNANTYTLISIVTVEEGPYLIEIPDSLLANYDETKMRVGFLPEGFVP